MLLGFEAGVSQTAIALANRSSSASATGFHLGVYGGAFIDGLRLRGGAAYSGYSIATTRQPDVAGVTDTLESGSFAGIAQVFADVGYAITLDGAALEPFAQLALVHQSARAYAETGGAAALAGTAHADLAAIATLGLRAETEVSLTDGRTIALNGMLGLQTVAGDAPATTHAFTGGTSFTVTGAAPGPSLVGRLGLQTEFAPGHTLAANLNGSLGATTAYGLSATLAGVF